MPCLVYPSRLTTLHCTQADIERDFSAEKFGLKTFPTLVLLPKVRAPFSLTWPHSTGLTDTDIDMRMSMDPLKVICTVRVFAMQNSDKVFKYPTDKRDVDTLKMWLSVMTS
jgi:hypothetical protein